MAPRQSAFAKRRRLNDGTATPVTTSTVSSSNSRQPSVTASEPEVTAIVSKPKKSDTVQHRHDSTDNPHGRADSENTFSALVDSQAVSFSHTREIEAINDRHVKVRLSQNQTCTVYGLCHCWVREGTVEARGAVLRESSDVHLIVSPNNESSVTFTALTPWAEVQLECISRLQGSASPFRVPGLDPILNGDGFTFRIIDSEDEVGIESTKVSRQQFVQQLHKTPLTNDSKLVIPASRSAETSEITLTCLNSVLHRQATSYCAERVLLLDTDFQNPMFSWPGTLGLFSVSRAILGALYAYPWTHDDESTVRMVSLRYTDCGETAANIVQRFEQTRELLEIAAKQNLPLILRLGSWIETASAPDLTRLSHILGNQTVATVTSTNSSPGRFEQALSTQAERPIRVLNIPRTAKPTNLPHNQMITQSLFRFDSYRLELPYWQPDAIPEGSRRKLHLTYGKIDAAVKFVLISGGYLRNHDVFEALRHNLVTLVMSSASSSHQADTALEYRDFSSSDRRTCTALGLAFVAEIDEEALQLHLNSTISAAQLSACVTPGQQLGLALQKPVARGCFGRHLLR